MKIYCLFAGVNGSGKSTFYHSNPSFFDGYVRVNTDEMLRKMNGNWKDPKDIFCAGKKTVQLLKKSILEGKSICQETTLTGNSIIKNIVDAKSKGYFIKIYYMGLESADLAISRVQKRVEEGGHGISEEDIRRRYDVSMRNLISVLPYCDKLYVYDNSCENCKPKRILIANFESSEKNINNEIPEWGKNIVDAVNSYLSRYSAYQ